MLLSYNHLYDIIMYHLLFYFTIFTDTPQFRGGNPFFFRENPYQSVSFIYTSMCIAKKVHAIHIAMQFSKNQDFV